MVHRNCFWMSVCLFAVSLPVEVSADGPQKPATPKLPRITLEDDLAMKTMGGRQFWGDVQFFHGWRIQQNVFTKHFRLLDVNDSRHASGSLVDCQAVLNQIRTREKIPPMSGRGVILLHGILRSSKCMSTISREAKKAGLQPFLFDYPSTQISIPDAAEYLKQSIASLEGLEELSIISHSMGGLVTRAYFAGDPDPRIKRVVMIGTPNHGAELADLLYQNPLIRTVSGPGGRQLVTSQEGLIRMLPAPKCEFGIIAGARGNTAGWNPFIPGDDDGTVTVESTRLVGAADFVTVPTTHTQLLSNPDAIRYALHFLKKGCFSTDRAPEPITAVEEER